MIPTSIPGNTNRNANPSVDNIIRNIALFLSADLKSTKNNIVIVKTSSSEKSNGTCDRGITKSQTRQNCISVIRPPSPTFKQSPLSSIEQDNVAINTIADIISDKDLVIRLDNLEM